ncbi:MAG: glycosyl hydrolase family 79 C-terminal domain-containing protein [Solirubrobacteraceae bacterium]
MLHRAARMVLVAALAIAALLAIGSLPASARGAQPRARARAQSLGRARAHGRAQASQADILASVSPTGGGPRVAPGFVGVSLEYRALHLYTGRDPSAVNPVFLDLLRGLTPGHGPVVRIGGNSTDATWWPIPGVIPPRGVTYGLTDGWLRTTRALASALGAHLILGVNLAAGRASFAAAEAHAFLQGIGRRYIEALEIGNEADVYTLLPWYFNRYGAVHARSGRYDLAAFTHDFALWSAALPKVGLAGPAFAGSGWLGGLPQFLHATRTRLVTLHRYPLRGCIRDPSSPSFASIPNLLSDRSSVGLAQSVIPYVAEAHHRRLPFRIDEMNSAACEGRSGVSETFASALWALDTLFSLARVGVDGVNLHTLPGAAYQLFSFTHSHGAWQAFVRPEYYGLLMFAQAAPSGSRLVPVSAPGGPVKIWATRGSDGRIRATLINKDLSFSHEVQLQIPGASGVGSLERLQAPTVNSTTDVSLGGRTFGSLTGAGTLPEAPQTTPAVPLFGTYTIDLPPASAALLTG